MPKDTKTLGNSKARACESLGFVHKKGCARVLTQPHFLYSDPGGSQTHDLQNRNLTLYSLSYQALNAGAKV